MTVDEALAIAETVLDGEGLSNVQELIFRQCWQGRCSDSVRSSPTLTGAYNRDRAIALARIENWF